MRLRLDLVSFDDRALAGHLTRCEQEGVQFVTMLSLGDTEAARRALYELNRECSQDIPGRGEFYSYDDYVRKRLAVPAYSPAGVIVALESQAWVGMCAISDWRSKGFMFNEMTGVRADNRRRGIATAMKVLGIRFAQSTGARWLYTVHDARNWKAIALNRRLGYVETDFDASLAIRDDR